MKWAFPWVATLLFATLPVTASAQQAAPAPQAATDKQRAIAEKFGADVTRAFNERDRKTLMVLLDFHELVVRAADFTGLTGKNRQDYIRGTESVGIDRLLEAYFRGLDADEGTVRFIRVTDQRPPRALVRFDLGDKGFNYLEFVLRTDAKGQTRAVDWFQMNTGELLSVTLGGASQLFAGANPGLVQRLLGGSSALDEDTVAKMRKAGELHRAKKYAEALALLKQLPEPLATSRIMLSAQITTAALANLSDEYDRALSQMAKYHSDDPAASFMLMDYYFLRKDVPQVLKALDTMEKRVGVDGATSLMRANTYALAEDYANGLKFAEKALSLEPDYLSAHDTRATLLVHLKRYPDAVDAYRGMEKRFGLAFTREIFLSDPVFEPLVASKAFSAWLPK